jgi:hypothetical protein
MLEPVVSRLFQLVIAAGVLLALVFRCDIFDLSFAAPMVLLPCWLGAFLGACALFVDAFVRRTLKKTAPHLWSALLLVLIVGPGIPFLWPRFLWISAAQKLLRHQAGYLAAVELADAGGNPKAIYLREDGPPRYYYFVWSGFADNSWGIVHDRSNTFAAADPHKTFHGDFVMTFHLWGPWYYLQLT